MTQESTLANDIWIPLNQNRRVSDLNSLAWIWKYEERPQSKFPTRPTAIKTIYIVKGLRVRDWIMTSHVPCTSGTSRIFTASSLQRLKLETLVPVPADFEVRPVIKFLNAKTRAPNEINLQLCQIYGRTRLDGQQISCSSSPYSQDLAPSDFHLFVHLKKFLSGKRRRFQNDTEAEMSVTVVEISGGIFLRQRIQNLVPRYEKCLNSEGE